MWSCFLANGVTGGDWLVRSEGVSSRTSNNGSGILIGWHADILHALPPTLPNQLTFTLPTTLNPDETPIKYELRERVKSLVGILQSCIAIASSQIAEEAEVMTFLLVSKPYHQRSYFCPLNDHFVDHTHMRFSLGVSRHRRRSGAAQLLPTRGSRYKSLKLFGWARGILRDLWREITQWEIMGSHQ